MDLTKPTTPATPAAPCVIAGPWGSQPGPPDAEAAPRAHPFLTLSTVYEAEISWWWRDERVQDIAYHIKVNDSIDGKVEALERRYDVTNDTRYCCQFEGVLLYGANKHQVDAAGRELARHLGRFKGVVPLD